jgi:large subunit ribosomal protein L18
MPISSSKKKKIIGTPEKPRLVIYRSLKYVYGQLIDDVNHKTLLSVSNISKDLGQNLKKAGNKTKASKEVGKILAERAVKQKIEQVVFDRHGYLYHGRIKAFAEGAREGGLKF